MKVLTVQELSMEISFHPEFIMIVAKIFVFVNSIFTVIIKF